MLNSYALCSILCECTWLASMAEKSEVVEQTEHTEYGSVSFHSEPSVNQGDLDEEDPEIRMYFDEDGTQLWPIPAKPIMAYKPAIRRKELSSKKRLRPREWIGQFLKKKVNRKEPSEVGSNDVASFQESNASSKIDEMIALRHALDDISRGLREHTALHGRGFMFAWIQRVREAFELDEIVLDTMSDTDWTWAMLATIPDANLRQRAYPEIIEDPLPAFCSCLEKLREIVCDMYPDE